MRVPKVEESDGGSTVIVGVKMDDPRSKELLTWALVKVASPGDQVVALHVIPEVCDPSIKCTSLLSLVKTFDSILAVYDGFCNLKQIDLKLKLCRGSSVRKVLVRETYAISALKLIVGVSKTSHTIRSSSASVAKYCSKKLPKECSVMAVNNGKIIFEKTEISSRTSNRKSAVYDSVTCLPARLSCGGSISRNDSKDRSFCSYSPMSTPPSSPMPRQDNSLALVPVSKPGWPLLRKAVLTGKKNSSHQEKPRISVVQWAMRLPSRYAAHTVIHPHCANEERAIVPFSSKEKEICGTLRALQAKFSTVCRIFSYNELVYATSNFASENLIGKGGSSRVYKGRLGNGKELAVKVLKQSDDLLREFVSEIEIVTALRHKNIISLFGFCFEDENLMLVYDLLLKGSLEETLHGDGTDKNALGWTERFKIAMGVAEALDYLHCSGGTEPVIHRDVKSSNILLSEDFEPQICDFGLAKLASSSSLRMTCNDVAGTFGYLAPEYFMYGKVNEKIDVYAFGVVLLELLSGKKPIDTSSANGNESLVMWAKEIIQGGKLKQLVDPCLGDTYDNDQMERMILAARLCIRRAPECRPHIAQVMKLIRGDENTLRWARTQTKPSEESDYSDEEAVLPNSNNIQSHINLALLDLDHNADNSLEEYIKGKWSRTSSFD